ncbi:MAG: nucleotidyltransferase domain-containing protein [Lentisphaerae bacterium]|nr:nucleotidyltransferase domain-containing protein [Lentisphaerota bacterium]
MTKKIPPDPNIILPVGTQIITRVEIKGSDGKPVRPKGIVGRIIKAPVDHLHSYVVQLPDGTEAPMRRHELTTRKQEHEEALVEASHVLAGYDLYQHVIYRCIVGSRAYGLNDGDSDTDRRGVYLPPAELQWSVFGVPEQLENQETEECYWELQKFITLALKANPNILECLYTPLVEHATPLAKELLRIRSIFLSKMIFRTFNGYAVSQFKKIEQDIRNQHEVKWKHAMHLVRLLICGIRTLEEMAMPVEVGAYRGPLLGIRRGEMPWKEVNAWRQKLHNDFDEAYRKTKLPERPDYEKANAFLIKARKSMV